MPSKMQGRLDTLLTSTRQSDGDPEILKYRAFMTDTTIRICLVAFPGIVRSIITQLHQLLAPGGDIRQRIQARLGQDVPPDVQIQVRSLTKKTVRCSEFRQIVPTCAHWDEADMLDLLILCAGPAPTDYLPMGLRGILLFASRAGATLGTIGTGGTVLKHLQYIDDDDAYEPEKSPDGLLTAPGRVLAAPTALEQLLLHWADTYNFGESSAAQEVCYAQRDITDIAAPAPCSIQAPPTLAEPSLPCASASPIHVGSNDQIEDTDMPLAHTDAFSPPRPHKRLADDPLLSKMRAVMADNIDAPLPVTQIAQEIGLSPKQLRLRCKKVLKTTPAQAYMELRLDHARELVTATALSVADIARCTGFASPSAFTRSYRRTFGQSPREARAL